MKLSKIIKIFIIVIISIISLSCTLNYTRDVEKVEKRPNFVFKNSNLDRYEENSLNFTINFESLEIYDKDEVMTGETVAFIKINSSIYNKSNNLNDAIESKGSAGIIKIDEKNHKYFMGNNVLVEDIKEKLKISGEAFFWDKNTNILFAPKSSTVTVKKGDEINIVGQGFIANTSSREFEFSDKVLGDIITKTKEEGDTANGISTNDTKNK